MARPRLAAFLATGGYLEPIVQEARRHQVIFDASTWVPRLLFASLFVIAHPAGLQHRRSWLWNGRLPPSHTTAVLCANTDQLPTTVLHPL